MNVDLYDHDIEWRRAQVVFEDHILGCSRCNHGKACVVGKRLRETSWEAYLAWSILYEERDYGDHQNAA